MCDNRLPNLYTLIICILLGGMQFVDYVPVYLIDNNSTVDEDSLM
jgi:hypothetical protein